MSLLRIALLLSVFASYGMAEIVVLEEIIAKVNGDIILRTDLDNALAEIRTQINRSEELTEAQKAEMLVERPKSALSDLIDERLLVQKGNDLGIDVETQVLRQRDDIMERYELADIEAFERWAPEATGMVVEDLMDRMRQQFMTQAVVGQEVTSRVTVSRAEIEAYYKEHPDEFVRSEGVRLAEILISNEDATTDAALEEVETRAKEVHDRVSRGELFDEMARRYSDSEASKERGGDIGIFRRGMLQETIEQEVFSANPGYITDLMPIARGFLILKVVERYREGLAELGEVEEEIRGKLSAPLFGPAVRNYLSNLREDAYIEIRPGYVDTNAVEGKDTSWSDPAKLIPVTTTRDELLTKKKKKKLLWVIPLPGGGGGDDADDSSSDE